MFLFIITPPPMRNAGIERLEARKLENQNHALLPNNVRRAAPTFNIAVSDNDLTDA